MYVCVCLYFHNSIGVIELNYNFLIICMEIFFKHGEDGFPIVPGFDHLEAIHILAFPTNTSVW